MIGILHIFEVALLFFLFVLFFHTSLGLQGKVGFFALVECNTALSVVLSKILIATNSSNTSLEDKVWKYGL